MTYIIYIINLNKSILKTFNYLTLCTLYKWVHENRLERHEGYYDLKIKVI